VTQTLGERGVSVVLLDIEGTTTPVAVVYDVLFPYAREHLDEFLASQGLNPEIRRAADLLREEHAQREAGGDAPPLWQENSEDRLLASVAAFCYWLMQRDVKSPGLKLLQGMIWKNGYASGEIKGEVFPDVPLALNSWNEAGLRVAIYSSGSVLAQKLLFGNTAHGDLTPRISAFFDTAVGPKTASSSYATIAARMDVAPGSVLFVSDVEAELLAAHQSGLQAALCVRPGNAPAQAPAKVGTLTSLAELLA
jgi:enolase-phosphatase E1